MQTKTLLVGLLSLTAMAEASAIRRPFDMVMARRALDMDASNLAPRKGGHGGFGGGNTGGNNNGGNNGGNAAASSAAASATQASTGSGTNNAAGSAVTLNPQLIQTGSQSDGDPAATTGEAASATDAANFINFCDGKLLTNGLQQKQGSCNGIVMGNIPATTNMVSSVFVNPQNNDDVTANQDFNITIQMANFAPGTFTDADTTYYSAPQDLDGSGNIIGHTHVTVQDLGNSLNPTTPLDATQFAFFKGINDAGNGQGLLAATVTGGLPQGNYRLCSMSSSANHQPVLMPVAQRGAQDDCVRFTVGGGTGNNNAASTSGSSSSSNSGGNNNGNGGNNK